MATKTGNEKGAMVASAAGGAIARTDPGMTFAEVDDSNYIQPTSFAGLAAEGFVTQRHVKLTEGRFIRGIYKGMEDGELSVRAQTGEVPRVKWVFVDVGENTTVRLLGAYNMISQLERAPLGSEVIIARGSDFQLPNGMRCTDYLVYVKPPRPGQVASAQVVETKAQAQAQTAQ